MSLPSKALFYNDQNELIATQFINVGWWLTTESLTDAFLSLASVKGTTKIVMYGIEIPISVSLTEEKWSETRKRILECFSYDKLKEFNSDYTLREKMKDFFESEQRRNR